MKQWFWLGAGAVVFAIVLALLLSGCARSAQGEAKEAQALCNGHKGVRALSVDRYGYIEFVTCNDSTVQTWKEE